MKSVEVVAQGVFKLSNGISCYTWSTTWHGLCALSLMFGGESGSQLLWTRGLASAWNRVV